MIKKTIYVICFLFVVVSCNNQTKQLEAVDQKADSLSSQLNSPELKAVNAELLKAPANAELYNKRARIYLALKQITEAGLDAKRAIEMDSTQAAFYLTLVDVYYAQNNTRKAKDMLELTGQKFQDNTEALLKLAELYFLVRQYQKGIDYVNKALKIDEHIAKGYYIKGSIYRESGDTAKAISSLETAVEQDNQYADAFYDLGVLFAARKNPIAFDYYNNALKINPANVEALYARAKLLQDLGKVDEAIADYKNIIKKFPGFEKSYYNLGAVYSIIKKDHKMALEYFTKAIEAKPDYVEAYFARAYTYTILKDKVSAKADYNMCLKIQPNYDGVAEALNELH